MKRVFKTRSISRQFKKTGITDDALCDAVSELAEGLHDGDLGGNVYKKRIAIPGRGKRGGARTLIATNRRDRWFFIYGLKKNERANVTQAELEALRELAGDLLGLTAGQLVEAVSDGFLEEITDGENER